MNTFLKFIAYSIAKWVLLWVFIILRSKNSPDWDWSRVNNAESIIYTFGILLGLPILEMIGLAIPFYLFIINKRNTDFYPLILFFALEFVLGWFMTSQSVEIWMLVKMALSIILFYLFFRNKWVVKNN